MSSEQGHAPREQAIRGLGSPGRILIVDDDPGLRYSLAKMLRDEGLVTIEAESAEAGLAAIKRDRPDLVLLDVRMHGMSGLEVLDPMRERDPKLPVIVMTAYGTTETAIQAMQRGAFDYVLKPFDPGEVLAVIRSGLESRRFMTRTVALGGEGETAGALLAPGEGPLPEEASDRLVGRSAAMQAVYKAIGQVAGTDVTVLIRGESGTGKELVARAIYTHSSRAGQPFLAVNCAAIPESLLESELFGYERGAFTGAEARRMGKFEQVSGGTLFLDEIGDMTPGTQAKVLRVLQDSTFERVGGSQTIHADVRVIAATNRDLIRLIREGRFREDLFYRLSVFTIELPPLRERREDISELVRYFIVRTARDLGKPVRSATAEVLAEFERRDWLGNVRELENTLTRAVLVCRGGILLPSDIAPSGPEQGPVAASQPGSTNKGRDQAAGASAGPPPRHREPLESHVAAAVEAWLAGPRSRPLAEAIERALLIEAIERSAGNQVQAARLLGIGRHALRHRIERLGLGPRHPRGDRPSPDLRRIEDNDRD
jgi:DNA-binding NtrC family response regulator